jgi:hypothetical protein
VTIRVARGGLGDAAGVGVDHVHQPGPALEEALDQRGGRLADDEHATRRDDGLGVGSERDARAGGLELGHQRRRSLAKTASRHQPRSAGRQETGSAGVAVP